MAYIVPKRIGTKPSKPVSKKTYCGRHLRTFYRNGRVIALHATKGYRDRNGEQAVLASLTGVR